MNKNEAKITRICWNSKSWRGPSGPRGKSKTNSFESIHGYGHEEWLFDKTKSINGYHYAFLQPLFLKKSDKHVGKTYDLDLFTVFQSSKFFVGSIKNVHCISKAESKKIYNVYKKNGWFQEMVDELKALKVDYEQLKNTPPEILFNIKFQFKDYNEPESGELEEIDGNDKNISTLHYKLLDKKSTLNFNTENDVQSGNLKSTKKRKKSIKQDVVIDPIHDKMQNALFELLKKKFKSTYKKVQIEKDRIDIKALTKDNKWHFYEIKTDFPKLSIRKALGQLLEYSNYPKNYKARMLFVVSDSIPNKYDEIYIKHLRNTYNIPIFYRYFDYNKQYLSDPY